MADGEVPRFPCMVAQKQPSELACFTCGAFLGHDGPLVSTVMAAGKLRRALAADCLVEYVAMLPGSADEIGDLLDALGHRRVCCRTHLLTRMPHVGLVEPALADMTMPA